MQFPVTNLPANAAERCDFCTRHPQSWVYCKKRKLCRGKGKTLAEASVLAFTAALWTPYSEHLTSDQCSALLAEWPLSVGDRAVQAQAERLGLLVGLPASGVADPDAVAGVVFVEPTNEGQIVVYGLLERVPGYDQPMWTYGAPVAIRVLAEPAASTPWRPTADEAAARITRWYTQAMQGERVGAGGRPVTWPDAASFLHDIFAAFDVLSRRWPGRSLTPERVAGVFADDFKFPTASERTITRALDRFGLTWPKLEAEFRVLAAESGER